MAAMDCTPSSASSPPATAAVPLSYVARCSIPLTAALSVIVSSADLPAAPNPFRCDFLRLLLFIGLQRYPHLRPLGADLRTYSYLTLALYRLLRHLIPSTAAAIRAAQAAPAVDVDEPRMEAACIATPAQEADDDERRSDRAVSAAPPSSPADVAAAWAAMEPRLCELLSGELRRCAIAACDDIRDGLYPRKVFTAETFAQPLLAVDAPADQQELSAWQLWLIRSDAWRKLASAVSELVTVEILEACGDALEDALSEDEQAALEHGADDGSDTTTLSSLADSLQLDYSAGLHYAVKIDEELSALWRTIGMPADCPAELDTDLPAAYQRQFEQQMRAAVAVSAPWMLDAQQVQQRVDDWMAGRLPGGDAVFFRRYHIRPLWHAGVELSDFRAVVFRPEPINSSDVYFALKAGVDLVDAAGVAHTLTIKCSVPNDNWDRPRPHFRRWLDIDVSQEGRSLLRGHAAQDQTAWLTDLRFVDQPLDRPPSTLDDYVCHGHLHGLSEQQWDEAMGGRLCISYYTSGVAALERLHDKTASTSREGMFPARLADVPNRKHYRQRQRTEIRRMIAIAARLVMLDEGVDPALFPCFQPVDMRRKFELVVQSQLETNVAGLPAALPRDLHGVVMGYYMPPVDIPM